MRSLSSSASGLHLRGFVGGSFLPSRLLAVYVRSNAAALRIAVEDFPEVGVVVVVVRLPVVLRLRAALGTSEGPGGVSLGRARGFRGPAPVPEECSDVTLAMPVPQPDSTGGCTPNTVPDDPGYTPRDVTLKPPGHVEVDRSASEWPTGYTPRGPVLLGCMFTEGGIAQVRSQCPAGGLGYTPRTASHALLRSEVGAAPGRLQCPDGGLGYAPRPAAQVFWRSAEFADGTPGRVCRCAAPAMLVAHPAL